MDSKSIALIFFFILAPAAIIYLETRFSVVKKIGAVLICYGVGLVIGNMGILHEGAARYQDLLSTVAVPLALPLILFSMDVKKWFKLAKSAIGSLLIGVFTVVLMIFLGYWIFRDQIDDIWKVSGMLVGIYTGGTPNMAAIKAALMVDNELYIMTHTYDLILSAVYLLFIMSIGQKVFLTFLPPFRSSETHGPAVTAQELEEEFESYKGIFKKGTILPLAGAFMISVLILGVSYMIGTYLVPDDFSMAAIIILITTFGIALSFVPRIKAIKKTFQLGMYFILVFCVVVSSMANIRQLANISFSLFYYVALAMFGSHILHAFLAKWFKIDADTVIISGSALICSPPFVPVVAGALKNREIILTGLTVGIVGYAIGTYLGVIIAYFLR